MSLGEDDANNVGILRGRDYPSVRQYSIFSPNKLGQLLGLMRLVETSHIRVCALSIADSADCAIIRLVVTQPERAFEVLKRGGYAFCEVDLVVVALPDKERPLLSICATLLQAEINIHYCYSLLVHPYGHAALAFHVDDHDLASQVLTQQNFVLLTEADLDT